jgi:hypothetical protein
LLKGGTSQPHPSSASEVGAYATLGHHRGWPVSEDGVWLRRETRASPTQGHLLQVLIPFVILFVQRLVEIASLLCSICVQIASDQNRFIYLFQVLLSLMTNLIITICS